MKNRGRYEWKPAIFRAEPPQAAAHGRVGLAFQLESPAAVDALASKLKRRGYQVDRTLWDTPWGHRQAVVYDPDGNSLDIFAPYV